MDDKADEPIKLQGSEPDLSTEEYMMVFNRCVNEGEELSYYLPAVKGMTPEELVDHVNLLSKFSARIRIAKQATKVTLEAKRIHLSKDQREALRVRDMQYKPKPAPSEDTVKRTRRASGTAKSEDAIETMMRLLNITREVAETRLAKAKARLSEEEDK